MISQLCLQMKHTNSFHPGPYCCFRYTQIHSVLWILALTAIHQLLLTFLLSSGSFFVLGFQRAEEPIVILTPFHLHFLEGLNKIMIMILSAPWDWRHTTLIVPPPLLTEFSSCLITFLCDFSAAGQITEIHMFWVFPLWAFYDFLHVASE